MEYEQNFHDIVLLNGNGVYPIEITVYDMVGEAEEYRIQIYSDKILFHAYDKRRATDFYETLGLKLFEMEGLR